MTRLLEEAIRRVASLSREDQDAIASQIIETLQDESLWNEKLGRNSAKLRRLAGDALEENRNGESHPLDDIL